MSHATNDVFRPGLPIPVMPDVLLLHGLTYDHRLWAPLLAELDPQIRTLAVDLPGHGASPRRSSYRLAEVAEVVHGQVIEAGLEKPVVVGHSVGGLIATAYAAAFPADRVINIDQPLLLGPFGAVVRAAEPTLRGPRWRQVWNRMLASMNLDSLPARARELVDTASDPRPDLLLGYWGDIFDLSDAQIEAERRAELEAIAARGISYHYVAAGNPPPAYLQWLHSFLPDMKLTVIEGSHFPQVANPAEIAALINS